MSNFYRNSDFREKLKERGLRGRESKYIPKDKVDLFVNMYSFITGEIGVCGFIERYGVTNRIGTIVASRKISTYYAKIILDAYKEIKSEEGSINESVRKMESAGILK